MKRVRTMAIRAQIKEDDLQIRHYSKLLRYNRRKSKNMPKIFIAEGLDCKHYYICRLWYLLLDILNVCDEATRKTLTDDSDYENRSDSSDQDITDDDDDDQPVEKKLTSTKKQIDTTVAEIVDETLPIAKKKKKKVQFQIADDNDATTDKAIMEVDQPIDATEQSTVVWLTYISFNFQIL